MNKIANLFLYSFIILYLISGCTKAFDEPKKLSIRVHEKDINYQVSEDVISDANISFDFAFDENTQYVKEELKIGDLIYFNFGDAPPDTFYIKDYLLTENGFQKYDEKLILDVTIQNDDQNYFF